jgi:hypothetical protein
MSRLALDILLLQRLGIIDIILVLVHSLYQKIGDTTIIVIYLYILHLYIHNLKLHEL